MRKITSIALDPEVLIRLKVAAAKSGLKVNDLIVRAVDDALTQFELQAIADENAKAGGRK